MYGYLLKAAVFVSAFLAVQTQNLYTTQFNKTDNKDTSKFESVFLLALQGNLKGALKFLDTIDESELTERQISLRRKYFDRFRNDNEKFDFKTKDSDIIELNKIYINYWHDVFLNNTSVEHSDSSLTKAVSAFLRRNDAKSSDKTDQEIHENFSEYLKDYLGEKGIFSATGKTGMYFDLLMHAKETEVVYDVTTPEDTIKVKVVFMEEILSNGWEDYATLGRYYPGGWAASDVLYCVKESYDLNSENFFISYLKHEGKHFADYKAFPKLVGPDLEYRAKLVELSEARTSLLNLIRFFSANSVYDRLNPHGFANYCVIRDLSKLVFGSEIENDLEKWESVQPEDINKSAVKLLLKNTNELKEAGAETVTGVLK